MALSMTEKQVTWSASNSTSVTAASTATSDVVTFTSGTVFQVKIVLKADNNGTPAAGDTVDFYLLESHGDPDGAGADEYDTAEQGRFLGILDTNADDPAQATVWVPGPMYKAKIYAVNNASSNGITVSSLIMEHNG